MNSVWIISYTRSLARYKYELSAYIPDTALWLLIKYYGHRIYVYNRHTTVIEYQVIYSDTSYVRKSDTECLILNLSVVFMDTLGLCSSPRQSVGKNYNFTDTHSLLSVTESLLTLHTSLVTLTQGSVSCVCRDDPLGPWTVRFSVDWMVSLQFDQIYIWYFTI